jgi:hypothetical protein
VCIDLYNIIALREIGEGVSKVTIQVYIQNEMKKEISAICFFKKLSQAVHVPNNSWRLTPTS